MSEQAPVRPNIPGYDILRPLGAGNMGQVFLAVQRSLDRMVVIKLQTIGDEAEELNARFEREAMLMAKVSHPNVAAMIDRGKCDGQLYMVRQYIEGESLAERIGRGAPIPIGESKRIIQAVGDAMAALHDQQIIHRDVKPANVLLDKAGRVFLTDFGIAVTEPKLGELTGDNVAVGTPDYMAPEQRHRLPIDQRADIYSMAVVSYELLTGRRPLGTWQAPSELNPQLNEDVDRVIRKGLANDPDERYAHISVFVDELTRALSPDAKAAAARSPSTGVMLGIAGMFCALLLVVIAVVQGTGASNDGAASPTEIRQVGALLFRKTETGQLELMLIEARSGTHYTIPKATPRKEQTDEEVAVAEALEEGGARGTAAPPSIGEYRYSRNGKSYRVVVYPVRLTEELTQWPNKDRDRTWLTPQEAQTIVASDGLRKLLDEGNLRSVGTQ